MTGKTHKAGGMLCSIIGFAILREKGLLLPEVSEGIQWLVMYPFCIWGSLASDLDHNPDSIPMKDIPSTAVNKVLHLTHPLVKTIEKASSESERKKNVVYQGAKFLDAKHRSWQTHSDLTLYVLIGLLYCIMNNKFTFLSALDVSLLSMVLMGISLGIIAHFILDMITPEGVWCIPFVLVNAFLGIFNPRLKILPEKIHFVPHKKFFATGGKWEEFIQKVLKWATIVASIWFFFTLLVPDWKSLIPFTISF